MAGKKRDALSSITADITLRREYKKKAPRECNENKQNTRKYWNIYEKHDHDWYLNHQSFTKEVFYVTFKGVPVNFWSSNSWPYGKNTCVFYDMILLFQWNFIGQFIFITNMNLSLSLPDLLLRLHCFNPNSGMGYIHHLIPSERRLGAKFPPTLESTKMVPGLQT